MMFDPNVYYELCSEMELSEDKLEEMIRMTEHGKKHDARRPLRLGIAAAAVAALLVVSVSAAGPAIRDFILGVQTGIYIADESVDGTMAVEKALDVRVEQEEDSLFLVVDGEKIDITEALASEGTYVWTKEHEGGSYQVTVAADGSYTIDMLDADGEKIPMDADRETSQHMSTVTVGEDGKLLIDTVE